MEIKEKFESFLNLLLSWRQSGTTTLIQKIAKKYNVLVIVESEKEKEAFGKKGVVITKLIDLRGIKPKPILVDNHVLLNLFNENVEYIKKLERENERYKTSIRNIKKIIELIKKNDSI